MIAALLPLLSQIGGRVAASLFPDPADKLKAQELEQRFMSEVLSSQAAFEKAAADIVRTEAASSHWLAANWRPLTMVTFVTLIVARWMGWSAPGMSEEEVLRLWDVVELGLGGYVVGRSAEKILPAVVGTMKRP